MSDNNKYVGINPSSADTRQVYQLLLHAVSPRPIAFVSTLSQNGDKNLAPFSFYMAGGANPPSVAFSPCNDRSGKPKHTLVNIQQTKEFVINLVTESISRQMNQTSYEYPYGISEWEKAGLTPLPSQLVSPPRVAESLIHLECTLFQIVEHGSGPSAANYIIGEVKYLHFAESIFDGDNIHVENIGYIARMAGDWYTIANKNSMFTLPRPTQE